MAIQLKNFHDVDECNVFLNTLAPEAIVDIKPDYTAQSITVIYQTDEMFHYKDISNQESSDVMELLAAHADNAWDKIDEAAGERSLESAVNLLCDQTLANYVPNTNPLSKARSILISPDLGTNFNQKFFNHVKTATAYRVYQLMLNTNRYDRAKYGFVLATYQPHDPNYQTAITYLYFLDNEFNTHGNYFALDAGHVSQWRLI